jgi:hypothetical protein
VVAPSPLSPSWTNKLPSSRCITGAATGRSGEMALGAGWIGIEALISSAAAAIRIVYAAS